LERELPKRHSVIVTLTAKPEQKSALKKTLRSIQRELPQVDGCLDVRVLSHADKTGCFTLVEDWSSQSQHEAHIQTLTSNGDWAKLEALLREPVLANNYIPLETEDINS